MHEDARELAHGLRHQARLQAHVAVAHVAVDLSLRREGRHGVDNDHVKRAALAELLADGEGLLAAVRLGDEQVVEFDADLARVARIERVLRVDERRNAAGLLRVRHNVQREGGLAARFLPVALDDASARQPAHTEREVERERARGDDGDVRVLLAAEAHDGKFSEFLLDLRQHRVQRRVRLLGGFSRLRLFLLCHCLFSFSVSCWRHYTTKRPTAGEKPLESHFGGLENVICSCFGGIQRVPTYRHGPLWPTAQESRRLGG